MSKPTTDKKIGGEYGDVRAAIDLQKLNTYLEACVPEVAAPVTVKQFKVRMYPRLPPFTTVFLWSFRTQFGQVCSSNLLSLQIPDAESVSRIRPTF